MGNTAQHCRLGLFQDSDFAGEHEDSKITSGGILCTFGSRTFVPISWMWKETDFCFTQFHRSWSNFSQCRFTHGWDSRSRSSGFSDWSISFLTKPNQQNQRCARATGKFVGNSSITHNRKQIPTTNTNLDLTNVDHVPSGGTHSGSNAMLFVFEDNEAVIKMIIRGRSLTMRHVSRTHSVALDWLFDRINIDSKNQIRYIDTKHQLADIFDQNVISHVTNGILFFICSTSAISAPLAVLRIPAW